MPDEASAEFAEGPELTEPEPLAAGGWRLETGNEPEPPGAVSSNLDAGHEPDPPSAGSWKLEADNQPDPLDAGGDVIPVPDRYARLGSEGLARLRARYAEVMARIADRPLDEDAREQLKLKAERLNPDAWVTADEVAAALEQYETVFEELRAVVGRQPRRHRRRRV